MAITIPHWPLPAVRDLTRDGRLSTYDERLLKLSKVSFRGKCACTGHPLKLPSPTNPARLGHFPTASQVGRPCVLYYIFSLAVIKKIYPDSPSACLHCWQENRWRGADRNWRPSGGPSSGRRVRPPGCPSLAQLLPTRVTAANPRRPHNGTARQQKVGADG